ncbi:general secretion pathway protein GspB [Candidatus Fermentibacteria bacterium]|nr:general secretion pathway protein GspB [Candidatus Fermentibacteria bacterium]
MAHQAVSAGLLTMAVCATALSCGPRTPPPTSVARMPVRAERPDTLASMEDSTSARFYVYEPGSLRDPFIRPGTRTSSGTGGPAEPTPPPLTIQGIIFTDSPRAMINGRSVGEGDVIEGATIKKINPNSVEIEFAGKRHTIAYR